MLIFWTGDSVGNLRKSVGQLVKQTSVPHEVFNFVSEIPDTKEGDLVFAMGGGCLSVLAKSGIVPKNRTINSLRGVLHKLPTGAYVMVSYTASIMDVDYSSYVDMLIDCRMALRYMTTGSLLPRLGTYRVVNNFSDACAWITKQRKKTGELVPVAIDTETLGKDYINPDSYIISVQLTYRKGASDLVYFKSQKASQNFNGNPEIAKQIEWLLTAEDTVTLRLANGKYDMNWFAVKWGLTECTTFKMDTTIVGSLLDENRSNSLNTHAKVYTNLGGYDDELNRNYDKGRMDLVPMDKFVTYAGGDSDACYRVAERLREDLTDDDRLANFYIKILHPAARAYETVEQVGWCVDDVYYEHLADELRYEIKRLEKQVCELVGGRIVAKHSGKGEGINLLKARMITDFMFSPMGLDLKPKMRTAKAELPSTAMDHLMMFKDHPEAGPYVKLLQEYSGCTKTYNTYVTGFREHLRADGRFHPNYFMFQGSDDWSDDEGGTVTGRLSVKDPAIQTIPKHTKWAKAIRKAFIAPPGFLILSNDYSQGELKIAACLANERHMIEAYQKGIDLHAITAARLSGFTFEQFLKIKEADPAKYEAIRQLGKAGNFGLIYGMMEEGFRSYAYWTYGVDMTIEEATKGRADFFSLYPGLLKWHDRCRDFARKNKFIVSPLGRVRHLPLIHSPISAVSSKQARRAINSPVQATLSDMSLWATAIMWRNGWLRPAPMFGMVHDQNLRYIPEDNWEKYVSQSVAVMENLPFHEVGWTPQLKFTVDSEVGKNLGELRKLPKAA